MEMEQALNNASSEQENEDKLTEAEVETIVDNAIVELNNIMEAPNKRKDYTVTFISEFPVKGSDLEKFSAALIKKLKESYEYNEGVTCESSYSNVEKILTFKLNNLTAKDQTKE